MKIKNQKMEFLVKPQNVLSDNELSKLKGGMNSCDKIKKPKCKDGEIKTGLSAFSL